MKRLYQKIIAEYFKENRQMIFLMGPGQAGKITIVKLFKKEDEYLSWDDQNDRAIILKDPKSIIDKIKLKILKKTK